MLFIPSREGMQTNYFLYAHKLVSFRLLDIIDNDYI